MFPHGKCAMSETQTKCLCLSGKSCQNYLLIDIFKDLKKYYVNVCFSVWGCMHVSAGTHRSCKRVLGRLELELQEVMSHPMWVL